MLHNTSNAHAFCQHKKAHTHTPGWEANTEPLAKGWKILTVAGEYANSGPTVI